MVPPLMVRLPSTLIPLGDEVSLLLLNCPPVVTIYTLPPLNVGVSGIEDEIEHEPNIFARRDESTLIGVYCVAEVPMPDGSKRRLVEVMSKAEVDDVRKCAAKGSTAWSTFYTEMAKKTVIRRASKSWPLTVDLHDAIARDAEGEYDFSKPVRVRSETPQGALAAAVTLDSQRETVEAEVIEEKTAIADPEAQEELCRYHIGKITGAQSMAEYNTVVKAALGGVYTDDQRGRLNQACQETKTRLKQKKTRGGNPGPAPGDGEVPW